MLAGGGWAVWLSQREMAGLFDVSTDNVRLHLKNLYQEGELSQAATTEDSSVVQTEGHRSVNRSLRLYNLDAITSSASGISGSLRGFNILLSTRPPT